MLWQKLREGRKDMRQIRYRRKLKTLPLTSTIILPLPIKEYKREIRQEVIEAGRD